MSRSKLSKKNELDKYFLENGTFAKINVFWYNKSFIIIGTKNDNSSLLNSILYVTTGIKYTINRDTEITKFRKELSGFLDEYIVIPKSTEKIENQLQTKTVYNSETISYRPTVYNSETISYRPTVYDSIFNGVIKKFYENNIYFYFKGKELDFSLKSIKNNIENDKIIILEYLLIILEILKLNIIFVEIKNNDIFYKYDTGDKFESTIILDTDDINYQILGIEMSIVKNIKQIQYVFKKNSIDDKNLLKNIRDRY